MTRAHPHGGIFRAARSAALTPTQSRIRSKRKPMPVWYHAPRLRYQPRLRSTPLPATAAGVAGVRRFLGLAGRNVGVQLCEPVYVARALGVLAKVAPNHEPETAKLGNADGPPCSGWQGVAHPLPADRPQKDGKGGHQNEKAGAEHAWNMAACRQAFHLGSGLPDFNLPRNRPRRGTRAIGDVAAPPC